MKPIVTEKAVMLIETENVLTFKTSKKKTRTEIKEEFEELFDAKVKRVRTLLKGNSKYAYIKLKKEFPAIDIATKLGII
jgi:large subunit ribosomal protein L23